MSMPSWYTIHQGLFVQVRCSRGGGWTFVPRYATMELTTRLHLGIIVH
jgi:hypothetical protein